MKKKFNRQQRSTARLGLVQMTFAHKLQLGEVNCDAILAFMEPEWSKPDMSFMKKRIKSILENWNVLERSLKNGLRDGWTLDRLDSVLFAICLTASDELMFGDGDAQPEIIVKEYADLTADFFEKSDVAFVNAYLNDLKTKIN